jgi:cellobiose phosphorylase
MLNRVSKQYNRRSMLEDALASGTLNGESGDRLFGTEYGYFSAETGNYIITDVLTPRPWANVLSNDKYGVVISQSGGGFSWADNCQLYRLSRWEQDLVKDAYGRYFYVQDLDDPSDLWSTTYQPTRKRAEVDQVEHAPGFTRFTRRFRDLDVTHTVFVPEADCAEVWLVTLENRSDQARSLRLGSFLEWHLGGVGDTHREFHRLFMESRREGNTLVAWKHPGLVENRRDPLQAPVLSFVSWSGKDGVRWITDKQEFLGRNGDLSYPLAFRGESRESLTPRWDEPVAGALATLDLGPKEKKTIVVTIGAATDQVELEALTQKYDEEAARAAFSESLTAWNKRCSGADLKTDDKATDLMVNRWFPYQAIAGRLWAKCAYYQQGGAYGYRDQLQDSLMLLDWDPDYTLKQLGRHAEAMYEDGGVRHWWHPNTDIFVRSHHSDTCLWLAYGVLEYLLKTGNLASLETEYAFLNRDTEKFGERGSLWAHCLRGIDRTLSKMSPRGLPLLGAGDWNDGLSHAGIEGKGESVWLAMFLFDIVTRWQPLLRQLGKDDIAERFAGIAEGLKGAVNEHAWDGEWYIAGTRDDGKPFGSKSCEEGQIFLNPQTWAVISGIAPADRIEIAMASVRERLVQPFGALLLRPAYSKVDNYIGYITRYAPGLRENGGVYSHASTWAVKAFAMLGDMETARAIFSGMLPPVRSTAGADLYAAEPYVMPGNIDGPDSPYAGRAGWTWYTGSAAWMVRVAKLIE